MRKVSGGPEVLEPGVVRNVVGSGGADDGRESAALAIGGAVRVRGLQTEAAHERAPGEVRIVEQVADVLARHLGAAG